MACRDDAGRRFPYYTFRRLVHATAAQAGLDKTVTPHTFRRSCTTELLRGGANMYHVKEFQKESRSLFAMASRGEIMLIVSDILAEELDMAPEKDRNVLASVPDENMELVEVSQEAAALRDAYMAAEVVGSGQAYDAFHVALATVARADLIVSWNFKHIVHFEKIRGFNAVNPREGYLPIDIRSPLEVV